MLWWNLRQLKSPKAEVRIKAALALRGTRSRKAVPALFGMLKDESPQARVAAIEALQAIQHPASAEPLAAALASLSESKSHSSDRGRDAEVSELAALTKALAGLGAAAVPPLLRMLESEEGEPRRRAAHVLGLIGDPVAVDPLIKKLEDLRSEVRKTAAQALGNIGDKRALHGLLGALASRDLETRRAAAEALGDLGLGDAAESLIKSTADQSEAVQIAAIQALGKIGGGLRVAACLRTAAAGPRKAVCAAAEAVLKSIRISPENPADRAEWAVIHGDFEAALKEGPDSVPAIIRALAFSDPRIRAKAAAALGMLRIADGVSPLLQALKDHDREVQKSAAKALAAVGQPALAGLKDSLSYHDASVVRLAAGALGEIGDPLAAEPLANLIAENRSVSSDYPEMIEAVQVASNSLNKLLKSMPGKIPEQALLGIRDMPEAVRLNWPEPSIVVDCTPIRDLAEQELKRRAQEG
jgi:HEAT repeat protein